MVIYNDITTISIDIRWRYVVIHTFYVGTADLVPAPTEIRLTSSTEAPLFVFNNFPGSSENKPVCLLGLCVFSARCQVHSIRFCLFSAIVRSFLVMDAMGPGGRRTHVVLADSGRRPAPATPSLPSLRTKRRPCSRAPRGRATVL